MAAPLEPNSFTRAFNHPSCDDLIFSHKIAPLLDKRSALVFSNVVLSSPHIKNLTHKADLRKIHQDIGKLHLKMIHQDLNQDLVDAIETTNRYVLSQLLNQCPDASIANPAFLRAAAIGDIEGMKIIIKSLGMYKAAKLDFAGAIKRENIRAIEFLMDPQNGIPVNLNAAVWGIYFLFKNEKEETVKKILKHNSFPIIILIIESANLCTVLGNNSLYSKFLNFLNYEIPSKYWKLEKYPHHQNHYRERLLKHASASNCTEIISAAIKNFPDEMNDSDEKAWRDCLGIASTRGQNELADQILEKLSKARACAD